MPRDTLPLWHMLADADPRVVREAEAALGAALGDDLRARALGPDEAGATGWAALADLPQATFASKIEVADGKARVTREVDGGLQTIKVTMPAIVTVDLRLNEPRYASLPNIMKAKKKPLDQKTAADLGVDVAPRLSIVNTGEPEARSAGIKVGSVDELVEKLKEAGAV